MNAVHLTRLTPAGRGGVATLLLAGENALDIFLSRFVSASNLSRLNYSSSRPYFGKLRIDESEQYTQAVLKFPQLNTQAQQREAVVQGRSLPPIPASVWEEIIVRIINSDNIEIHCHGGNAIFTAIEKSFVNDGVQTKNQLHPSCLTKPEAVNTNTTPQNDCPTTNLAADNSYGEFIDTDSQRELALRLLPFATTERVAQILLDQYHGAMEHELAEIDKLTAMIARMAVSETEDLRSQLRQHLQRIEENKLAGQHLIKPFRVVLTGKTNVGKSSLFNAILGYNRAIVSPLSGTTRDVVVAQTSIAGFPVEIYDTAGIRNKSTDEIEHEGIRRTIKQIDEADLVIRVIDLSELGNEIDVMPINDVATKSQRLECTKNILTCCNKSDLLTNLPDGICVSAKTGDGIADLIEMIGKTLIPNPPLPFEAVPIVGDVFFALNSANADCLSERT
ncbi:MAG: 50S ribosome-binding GTPase [Planctomycetaceae bacterium]|jgi:tRNA modification GTPase|nr:50S ribosome-binding GTPase [Planctomycetaceae bacterium]